MFPSCPVSPTRTFPTDFTLQSSQDALRAVCLLMYIRLRLSWLELNSAVENWMIKIWQFRVYCSLLSYYPLCPHTEITGKCILPARPAQTQLGNIKYLRIFLLFLYNEMFLLCVFTQTISTVVMGGHWLLALQWDCKFWTSQMAARCNPWFPVSDIAPCHVVQVQT